MATILVEMEDCIFCKIVGGEIAANFVYEGDDIVAFKDIKPSAPVHVLVVPKKHIPSLSQASEADRDLLGKVQLLAGKIAKDLGIGKGFRLTLNNGKSAGQIVFHLHYHLQGGWEK